MKNNNTKKGTSYITEILKCIATKHNISLDAVYKYLNDSRGKRNTETSESIKKDYKTLAKKIDVHRNSIQEIIDDYLVHQE